jgi:zinc-ribbon domain
MRCPSCGAEVEASSTSCPRCGTQLGSAEAEATARIGSPTEDAGAETGGESAGGTQSLPTGPPRRSQDPFGPKRAFYDFLYAVRRALAAGGWFDAASAAALGFLALLCVGVVFLVAARLQYPDIGTGTNPLSVFTSIVLLALGSLRIPIHVGDVTVTALPLGALVLSAAAVSWAVEPAIRRREVTGLRAHVAAGAKIAIPFALLCCAAALVFRFRGGASPTHAAALSALLLGAVWGTLFGALGGVRSRGSVRSALRSLARASRERLGLVHDGLEVGGLMLVTAFVTAAAAGLLWIIAGLARGAPVANFGGGDALAGFLYVLAFLPNLLVAILAIAFGGSVDVGAQITIGGRQIGPLKTISLWDWGAGGTPWLAFGLLVVPVVAMVGAGFIARRRSARPRAFLPVIVVGAIVFALVTALVAWLGQARLGAGLVRSHGFAVVAARADVVLLVCLAWAVVGGVIGWKLAERRDSQKAASSDPTRAPEGAPV